MIIKVHMLAFMNSEVREVVIPDSTLDVDLLETVYLNGQNDHQPSKSFCSVSSGDVIEVEQGSMMGYWLVKFIGYEKLTDVQFEEYKRLPPSERWKTNFSKQVNND